MGPGSCEYEHDGSKEEGWIRENQPDLQLLTTYAPEELGRPGENGKGGMEKSVKGPPSKYSPRHLHLEAKFGFSDGYST